MKRCHNNTRVMNCDSRISHADSDGVRSTYGHRYRVEQPALPCSEEESVVRQSSSQAPADDNSKQLDNANATKGKTIAQGDY